MTFNKLKDSLGAIGLLVGVTIITELLPVEPLLAAPRIAATRFATPMFALSLRRAEAAPQTSRRPMIQNQLAETALLLRSSQNPGNLTGDETGKLMNLCRIIGQSQVLLLQVNTKWLSAKKKKHIDKTVEKSITDLNLACDGGSSTKNSLKKAWNITGKVQRRLTMVSKSLQSGGTI